MLQELVENIIYQADYFLKECGEFYPFASVWNKNDEIKPLGILLPNDHPNPEVVIQELNRVLKSGKELKEYKAYAIGINTSLKRGEENWMGLEPDNENLEWQDALEIRITTDKSLNEEIIHLPYSLNPHTREIVFGDFIRNRE